ncbi:hypothetical protein SAI_1824 [Streptococcus agalactiae H36B]|nr:hypothetical protein SAI_1824 [Streptococcus agalactiae H36B]
MNSLLTRNPCGIADRYPDATIKINEGPVAPNSLMRKSKKLALAIQLVDQAL